jgi:HSP20 family protein
VAEYGSAVEPGIRQQNDIDMNTLVHWNPFKEMEQLQRRLSSVFDLAPLRQTTPATSEENMTVPEWTPAVDIIEDDKGYLIKVELPEVRKEDVKVTVEGGTLTISGERKVEKEEKGRKFHRIERLYGNFERSFSLPDDADDAKVNAEFKDGLLRVYLNKTEKARPKQIEVKVG